MNVKVFDFTAIILDLIPKCVSFQIQDENSTTDLHTSLMIGGQATKVYQ